MEQESKITNLLRTLCEEWEEYQHKQWQQQTKLEAQINHLNNKLNTQENRTNTIVGGLEDLVQKLRGID